MENNEYCKHTECNELWDEDQPDCKCGEIDFRNKCKNYVGNDRGTLTEKRETKASENGLSLPWHANAMGELDMAWVKTKRFPFIIGVVGPAESGKTTLLATLYMLLRSGKNIGRYTFAGSYTLLGWEKIANFMSFHAHKVFYFPPHTSSNTARLPGLLHLRLKDEKERFQDVLFTDAPGEWFTNWAKRTEGDESKGARWIDQHADASIIIADTQAFTETIGKARNNLYSIVEKIRNTQADRPLALVWTKADKEIDADIKAGISAQIRQNLPHVNLFDTAVINLNEENENLRENVLELINYLLLHKYEQKNKPPVINDYDTADFFLSLRLKRSE